jgi:hypothetical protein
VILDPRTFKDRLEDELDRAIRYGRAFSVLCMLWSDRVDRHSAGRLVAAQLQRIDAASWGSETALFVMLAEAAAQDAARVASRLRDLLHEPARLGHATYPSDGADIDALRASARTAAERADPGAIVAADPGSIAEESIRPFRPIADEIRELEIARMTAALAASRDNHTRAAALISMPVRTFFKKLNVYGLRRKRG